ncbi:DUF4261 domain-containing protein [Hymenobacter negativus]|uniref:DUF4261 domain-containing protein n=1 Tax=Hymenobacter negativus TaxID=2795026 RepID=A0ABS0Q6L2_9BACT|nr:MULTISPECIES: DUF4261 domain-containing protein [Bacteria]MBH8558301.1 DUF4261 domain-containing protein [Hymenobacter negativus]MBH8568791.1 DUF4261 domain-containing protein [Hymenobacter negativus]MBR7208525.1 DUF4261 domain-containing protein [Microvirga sp. STS02]
MGFFDFGKKKKADAVPEEPLRNYPQLLTAKLLFAAKPTIDKNNIIESLAGAYPSVHSPDTESVAIFSFPSIEVEFKDGSIPAQWTIMQPNAGNENAEVAPEALQQNWHWAEAAENAEACNYEVLVSDFMSRTLDYKIRLQLFMDFLVATTHSLHPQVVYLVAIQKLIAPEDLIDAWTNPDQRTLHGLVNVRLFNISNGTDGEILMDTVGLHQLGLPDFQIRFAGLDESAVGQALWNYAYYVYEHGDIIADGNTIQGLTPQAKWQCERQIAAVAPERVVIHLHTS